MLGELWVPGESMPCLQMGLGDAVLEVMLFWMDAVVEVMLEMMLLWR